MVVVEGDVGEVVEVVIMMDEIVNITLLMDILEIFFESS